MTTFEAVPLASTSTAWWGWCARCGVPFGNHDISCTEFTTISVMPIETVPPQVGRLRPERV